MATCDPPGLVTHYRLPDLRTRRGLAGVEYVVGDEHAGLVQAPDPYFPEAAHQRCRVHYVGNALAASTDALRTGVNGAARCLAAPTREGVWAGFARLNDFDARTKGLHAGRLAGGDGGADAACCQLPAGVHRLRRGAPTALGVITPTSTAARAW